MDELINALRRLSDWSIMDFEDNLLYANQIAEKAADAIEELSKYVNTIMRLKSEGWYLQQTKNHDGYAAIATMPLPEPPKEG